jgi:hypothetical protein
LRARVDLGYAKVGVAEQLLDRANVVVAFEQVGCDAVADAAEGHTLGVVAPHAASRRRADGARVTDASALVDRNKALFTRAEQMLAESPFGRQPRSN